MDVSPLRTLTALQLLDLDGTPVVDLRPLVDLPFPFQSINGHQCLRFKNTAAAVHTLNDLSEIQDNRERTDKTLAYLRTLPPYPAPLAARQSS